ncbi:MAG: RNB domain-containing ribonuclease, partial [Phycisphaerales bacterium]|nr:RNB domain-containing ribonuclease [Phycisphaerales bacterium]
MHDRIARQILEHLRHPNYAPSPVKQIAKEMRIDPEDRDDFDAAIGRLIEAGKILKGKKDDILLPSYGDEVEGRLKLNPRGFGFIIPDDYYREGHLFVPPGRTNNAISGDRVRAVVSRRRNRAGKNDVVGDIVEILERGQSRFTGELYEQDGQWFVEPDGKLLHDPVVIRDPHAKNAKVGDKVVIELLHYPDHEHFGEGVITEVLGAAGAPDVETEAVIVAHGLHTVFSEEALEQARNASRQFDDDVENLGNEREDLRDRFIFTIDPPDAKDFDDAICIAFDESSGEWELGVHIADVAHFVKKGSPLDRDAMERGNSVYLPRRVLPMLPEVLSNGVCSLQEGVDRFTKSVFIRFDARGRVLGQRMANTIINSRKRLTYLEAQALIDGDQKQARKHSRTSPAYTDEMVLKLQLSDRLAKILRKRRIRDGMITLNLPEIELVFDDDGHVIDAVPEDDAFTHTIIEMFMV